MPTTRRDFLRALSGAAAVMVVGVRRLTAEGRGPRAAVLRLAIVTGGLPREHLDGLRFGLAEAGQAAALFGSRVEATWSDDAPPPDAVPAVVIGGWTDDECARLAAGAHAAGAVYLNAFCTDDVLRGERCAANAFHVAPSDAMLADAARLAGGGEATWWDASLEAFGAAQLNDRFRHAHGRAMDARAWSAWMAVKVAAEASFRARAGEGAAVRAQLARADARFDGHKGMPLSFRPWDRQLRQPLYVRRAGEVMRVPARGATGAAGAQLDAMGATAATTACRAGA